MAADQGFDKPNGGGVKPCQSVASRTGSLGFRTSNNILKHGAESTKDRFEGLLYIVHVEERKV